MLFSTVFLSALYVSLPGSVPVEIFVFDTAPADSGHLLAPSLDNTKLLAEVRSHRMQSRQDSERLLACGWAMTRRVLVELRKLAEQAQGEIRGREIRGHLAVDPLVETAN